MTRVSDPISTTVDNIAFDPSWTSEASHAADGGPTPFTSQENSWLFFDPIFGTAADCAGANSGGPGNYVSDQQKLPFGIGSASVNDAALDQHASDTFAHLLEQSLTHPKAESSFPSLSSSIDDRVVNKTHSLQSAQDTVLFDTCPRLARSLANNDIATSSTGLRLSAPGGANNQRTNLSVAGARGADTAKRRPRRASTSVHTGTCNGGASERGFSPSWSRRSSSLSNKSFSNSLSRFTLPDENGKRRIRNDIMSIAESLPALPGLYFDKKQKGFRVRYQNVYVGWVALSRFPSIEEAYISAREIWESAKCHAEKFQTPHAAVMASYPLQKEAQASGKNRGGRPRTVTQLPPDPSNWLSTSAFLSHQNASAGSGVPLGSTWSRGSDVSIYGHDSGAAALCDIRNSLGDAGVTDMSGLSGVESFWSPAGAFSSHGSNSILTPVSASKSASDTPHHATYTFCQPPSLNGYLGDACALLEPVRDEAQRGNFGTYTRSICIPQHCSDTHPGLDAFDLDQQSEYCHQYNSDLPGAISFSQPVPEDLTEPTRKRRRDECESGEPESKRSDWPRHDEPGRATPLALGTQPREASPSDASTAIPPQSPDS